MKRSLCGFGLAAALLAGGLALPGCESGGGDAGTPPAATPTPGPGPAADTAKPDAAAPAAPADKEKMEPPK